MTFPTADPVADAAFAAAAADPLVPYRRVPNPQPAVAPALLMYVMHHFPGNTAVSWRRQFFGDIAHGVKYFDLFDFVPSFSGYTDDYVDSDGGAFTNVRRAFFELSRFEDIVQGGAAQAEGAAVAMLFSESANYWLTNAGTMGSAKRTLYLTIRHAGVPVDPLIEEDLIADRLRHYNVLYVNDAMVSEAATAALSTWVAAGGVLFATAGALGRNEFNASSTAGEALLGPEVAATAVYVGTNACPGGVQDHRCMATRVQLEKQDLPFVEELDVVTLAPELFGNSSMGNGSAPMVAGVYGEKAMLKVLLQPGATPSPGADDPTTYGHASTDAARAAKVVANFSDGSPAAVVIPRGKGTIWYTGFHPGLAYFRTALPDTEPPCKGSTDDSNNHRVTTGFNSAAAAIALAPLTATPWPAGAASSAPALPARPVTSVPPLVEVGVVSAGTLGTVLPCINWSGGPQPSFNLTLHFAPVHPVTTVSTATGTAVQHGLTANGFHWFSFALESAADAVILRP